MEITEQIDLLLKNAAAAVSAPVVVAEDYRRGLRQARDGLGEAQITITQVSDKQHCIGCELLQQLSISLTPLPVQITGNGKA